MFDLLLFIGIIIWSHIVKSIFATLNNEIVYRNAFLLCDDFHSFYKLGGNAEGFICIFGLFNIKHCVFSLAYILLRFFSFQFV